MPVGHGSSPTPTMTGLDRAVGGGVSVAKRPLDFGVLCFPWATCFFVALFPRSLTRLGWFCTSKLRPQRRNTAWFRQCIDHTGRCDYRWPVCPQAQSPIQHPHPLSPTCLLTPSLSPLPYAPHLTPPSPVEGLVLPHLYILSEIEWGSS